MTVTSISCSTQHSGQSGQLPDSPDVVAPVASATSVTLPVSAAFEGVESGGQAFGRQNRLLNADEFSTAFRSRPFGRSPHFVLYARPGQQPVARLGVVAGKKMAPRAVTRNMVKRVTRDAFRLTSLPALDCVIRLSAPVCPKKQPAHGGQMKRILRAELEGLLAQLLRRYGNQPAPRQDQSGAP